MRKAKYKGVNSPVGNDTKNGLLISPIGLLAQTFCTKTHNLVAVKNPKSSSYLTIRYFATKDLTQNSSCLTWQTGSNNKFASV